MDSEAGQEYWLAMNLAGDYASACHEVIHKKLMKAIGGNVMAKVENHHNFAWKEVWNGEEVIGAPERRHACREKALWVLFPAV